jgi:hypothetical protein
MPFFIPALAIGAGVAIAAWGTKMMINNDDSADAAAAKFLRTLPEHIKKYVHKVEYNQNGLVIHLNLGTPDYIRNEIQDNLDSGRWT